MLSHCVGMTAGFYVRFFYVHDAELMSIMTLSLEFHPLSLANKYTLPKRSGNKAIMLIFTASALL